MRYRINALSCTITRKYWKAIVAFLILIIIYQRIKLRNQSEEHGEIALRSEWPFKTSQRYDVSELVYYSPVAVEKPDYENPGEMGTGVAVPDDRKDLMKKMYRAENFNVIASNMMSLQRSLEDMRHPDCYTINYPTRLPKASVIIVFHNEVWSTLIRTIWSIINRTPKELLAEIILVDDLSTRAYLRHDLTEYVSRLPVTVKIIRTRIRQGVVRARAQAAYDAIGQVLVFLDSHIECTRGWLEPMLSRIAEDRSVLATPHIDSISIKSMAYRPTDLKVFGFDWDLLYFEMDITETELERRNDSHTAPIRTPIIVGCAFAIDRDFFHEIGTYDQGMDIIGTENIEISVRTWLCGGSVEILPCSRVGHLFRRRTYSYEGDEDHIKAVNNARFAEVWMDKYKEFFYAKNREAKYIMHGDLSSRFRLQEDLKCKHYNWYLENVYTESEMLVDSYHIGQIINVQRNMCFDIMNFKVGDEIRQHECQEYNGDQSFAYMRNKRIMPQAEQCLGVGHGTDSKGKKRKSIVLEHCSVHDNDEYMQWEFDEENRILVNIALDLCVTAFGMNLYLEACDASNDLQRWLMRPL